MDVNGNIVEVVDESYDMDSILEDVRQLLYQDKSLDDLKCISDDSFLSKFVVSRGYDVKKAASSIRLYIHARETHPEIFTPVRDLKPAFESGVVGILPNKNPIAGETVLITRPGNWDPSHLSFQDFSASIAVTLQVASMDAQTQKAGVIDIIDMTGFGWKQLKSFGPFQARRTAELTEKLLPVCFKEIHIINESYLARMAYTLVKSFLSEDFVRKIHFHGSDLSTLHTIVSKDVLPSEMGGHGSFDAIQWFDYMCTKEGQLLDEWRRITD